jgi:hypothetical protein
MIATLLSFLGGNAFRLIWGEVSAAWTKYQDHKHELALMQVQAQMEAARHAQNLEAIRVQAELGVKTIQVQAEADIGRLDAEAFSRGVELTGTPSGIGWVDAWNGAIRPALATLCMALWALHMWRAGGTLDDQGWALLGAALGIYVADRTLTKRGK